MIGMTLLPLELYTSSTLPPATLVHKHVYSWDSDSHVTFISRYVTSFIISSPAVGDSMYIKNKNPISPGMYCNSIMHKVFLTSGVKISGVQVE